MSKAQDPTTVKLLSETTQGLSALIRDELALLQSSLSVGAKRMIVAIAILVCAVIMSSVATIVLALAAVDWLILKGFSEWGAGLAVGLGLLGTALLFVLTGLVSLRSAQRHIAQPVQNIRRDVQAVKAAYYDQ